jgi:ABC-type polysaccharide/polyol phosphate transport system ATPase subunit
VDILKIKTALCGGIVMKPENAIEVNHISKKFKVYMDKGHTLKEKMLFSKRRKYEERIVLDDISFEVKKGEAIGLIGQNGCGKSTTLKLLTRIMYPDSGNIEMCGRVSSLIELGAGFHPDMSGRQNIYTNASIFGLTRKEIEARFDDIVAFSELEQFIDNPVRTYSSGMYMRLAFSVAINVDADILLIDEILSVGDSSFQTKCFKKILDLKKRGVTIIIVSHDLQSIQKICDRCIWIQNGKVEDNGYPFHVINRYLKYMEYKGAEKESEELKINLPINQSETISSSLENWGNKKVFFENVFLRNMVGTEITHVKAGESFWIELEIAVNEEIKNGVIGIGINDDMGKMVFGLNTDMDAIHVPPIVKRRKISLLIKNVNLISGEYTIHASISDGREEIYDWYPVINRFFIDNESRFVGIFYLDHDWNFD